MGSDFENFMKLKKYIILFFIAWAVFPASNLDAAEGFDHSLWDSFLKKYVNEKGEVNYQAVQKDPALLNDYLAQLMTMNELLAGSEWPREESLAFWLNAYHAVLVKLVVEHYPVTSVQRIPSFWDITVLHFGKLGLNSAAYGLNDIRVKKLINVYHNEKIHLALSQASKDGPRLLQEAFLGPKVEGQLFLLTREFINNPANVDIVPGRKKIKLSKIFKWYEKDFNLDFGAPEPIGKFSVAESSVLSFLAYYLEDEAKVEYLEGARYKIQYPAFNWALNDWKGEVPSSSASPKSS